MTREKTTRRAAIGMIAGGGALLGVETAGFATVSANRIADLTVADEPEDAMLGVVEGLDEETTYEETPHEVTVQNNFDEGDSDPDIDLEVDLSDSTFELDEEESDDEFTSDTQLPTGEEATAALTVSDDVTDTVIVSGTGGGATATLEREITVEADSPDESDDEFQIWLDAEADETFSMDGDDITEWETRSEEGLDAVDETGDEDPLPERHEDGWVNNDNAVVTFEDDDLLTGSSIDVSETHVMSLVALIDPTDGDRAVSLIDDGNDGQQVSFDLSDDEVTIALEDADGKTEETELSMSTIGTDPQIISVVLEGASLDEQEEERDYDVRLFDHDEEVDEDTLSGREESIGDFELGVGGEPVDADVDGLDISSGEPYEGDVAEVLIYERVIDDGGNGDELDDVVTYLEDKWDL